MQLKNAFLISLISALLIACGGGGESKPDPNPNPAINNAPVALITLSKSEYSVGDNVELSASDSTDPDQDTLSFEWRVTTPSGNDLAFDNSTQQVLSFNAEEPGRYAVELRVTDSKGATSTKNQSIVITPIDVVEENHPPIAVIDINPQNPELDQIVTLSASNSTDEDGDELTYLWQVEDPHGQFIEFVVFTTETLEFSPSKTGSYKVTLTVTDIHDAEDTEILNFNVTDSQAEEITAIITGDADVKQSDTVSLSGESSELLYQTSFKWSIVSKPPASNAQLTSASSVSTQFIADQVGEYRVELSIEDIKGNTDEVSYLVKAEAVDNNSAPVAKINAEETFVSLGQKFNLSGVQSSDADNDHLAFSWEVIKAPSGSNYTLSAPQAEKTELSSDTSGEYQVSLTVDDGKSTDTDTITLRVGLRNTVPIAGINIENTRPKQGETITFYGVALDKESTNLTYEWKLLTQPEGSTATFATPTAINSQLYLDKSGEYLVSFTASDGELTSDPATKTIKASVNHPPVITKVNHPTNIKTGEAISLSVEATDPEGQPLTFTWSIVDKDTGTTGKFSNITEAETEFTANHAGWYTLSVSANDGIQESELPSQFILIATD